MSDVKLRMEIENYVAMLEAQHEEIERDLKVAREFLAVLNREIHALASSGYRTPARSRTHAEIVEDAVMDILAGVKNMHRQNILEGILARGVHIGNDHDNRKQLAALSSILSRSPHFIPAGNGHWMLATRPTNEYEYEEYVKSGEAAAQGHPQRESAHVGQF